MGRVKLWSATSQVMSSIITNSLADIEQYHGVKILFAVESGSRVWGFHSANSDYDVRFVYTRDEDHYLSIDVENKRDVIERVGDPLDISGWDIRKALKLFAKSNPGIMEWVKSDIVYVGQGSETLAKLRDMAPCVYSPVQGYYHYRSMARHNLRNYLQGEGDSVRVKKYLYVIRGLLCSRWVGIYLSSPPLNLSLLIPMLDESESNVVTELGKLLMQKRSGGEMEEGNRVVVLDDFIQREFESETFLPRVDKFQVDYGEINSLFRGVVRGDLC